MSTSGQHQFRYTQTPSKVLHLRNLPWECTEDELVELCKPFGRIVNTKCNVGASRNQAFVEFVDLNQAINMVTYYASSSEPAQVRGKTVYIQYSNRHEIVNNKGPGDVPGNVLLVTIEGVEAADVSIDVIHLLLFVHKIATFEKAAGFQALIQFSNVETASSATAALDGRSIPRYLLPDCVGSCHLRISYSAHTDLNIKFQSHRSRDYTNPYLTVNPTAIEGFVQVFSAFGTVQKMAIFEKNGGTQALIQYPDVTIAAVAKDALEGHCIYEGGYCLLATHQAPGVPATAAAWHNSQGVPVFPGNEFAAGGVVPAQPSVGQVPSWDPMQGGSPTLKSVPSMFPGQTYVPSSVPAYATAATPAGSSPLMQTGQIIPTTPSIGESQAAQKPNIRPGGALPPGQPHYYGAWPILIDDFVEHIYRTLGSNDNSNLFCCCGDSKAQQFGDPLPGLRTFPGLKRKMFEDFRRHKLESSDKVPNFDLLLSSKRRHADKLENWKENPLGIASNGCMEAVKHNGQLGCSKSPCAIKGCPSKGFAGPLSGRSWLQFDRERRISYIHHRSYPLPPPPQEYKTSYSS